MKRLTASALELLWREGFALIGRQAQRNIPRWVPSGNERVLVVGPHPDDEAIGCAGAIVMHVRCGDKVCVAIVTDGRRSRAVSDPDEMCRRRYAEFLDAGRLMGAQRLEWIGLREGEWSVSDLLPALRELLSRFRPTIIYAPSRVDFHPEHLRVAHGLAMALQEALRERITDSRMRAYPVQVPLTPAIANLLVDVSALTHQWKAILRQYPSQSASTACAYRQRRYNAVLHGIRGHAEVFWEMSADRYVELHTAAPQTWPSVFRGLRNWPLTDPLAYLVGAKERKRLSG